MSPSGPRRVALWARGLPLGLRWVLTILVFASLIATVVIVNNSSSGKAGPEGSEASALAEAQHESEIVIAQDQAPHTAQLAPGSAPQGALERAIAADVRERIRRAQLTGPLQSVHCTPSGAARAGRQAYACTVRSAGIEYRFDGVSSAAGRLLTWCKVDPPPEGEASEVALSPLCRP